MTDTIEVGDFVTAKSAKYEGHKCTGTCAAIQGDKIVVRDRIGILPEECYLEGAVIVPVSARVTASRADDWQPKSEPIKLPDHTGGWQSYKDSGAFQVLLAGIATSTVAAISTFIREHEIAADAIKVELRYTSKWVTTRKSESLGHFMGGELIACGEGHSTYVIYMNVSLDGDIDRDKALTLKCTHLTFHQIKDLDIIKAKIHIEMD